MALFFCTVCGDTLKESTEATVRCDCCGTDNQNDNRLKTTTTKSNNFPSVLRAKLSKIQQLSSEDLQDTGQKTQKECPECHVKEMSFSAVQIRSADEGTTIFYRCACGYREKEDN